MSKSSRILLIIIPILLIGLAIWQLGNVVAYVLIAFVISMIGQPLVDSMQKIGIRGWHFPRWLCSLLTLIIIWVIIFSFFLFFIPLLAKEFQFFSNLDIQSVFDSLKDPIARLEHFVDEFKLTGDEAFTVEGWATNTLTSVIGLDKITSILSGMAGALGNLFVAFIVISFTSFFFMKEARLFENSVVLFFPQDSEQKIKNAINSISRFLKRYFIGVTLQTIGIIILNTTGLLIVGLEFSTAVTIGLVSGVLNVIPYIGPLIGIIIGLVIGTAVSIPADFYTELLPHLIFIFVAMEITQIIDNVVFQPLIFSKSVKAHPLEIFLVIISAGTLGGVIGMILAVPSYTVLRVVAKEFLSQSKLVQKLTERL